MNEPSKPGSREPDSWERARRQVQQLHALLEEIERLWQRPLVRWLCWSAAGVLAWAVRHLSAT